MDGRVFQHPVKAGNLTAPYVRDLRGVIEREKAAIGVLITMHEPTKQMRAEAASAGFYDSKWQRGTTKHPRLQIITVGELLKGKRIDCPPLRHVSQTFKQAPKVDPLAHQQQLTLVADEPANYGNKGKGRGKSGGRE